jgi:cell division protein ZapA
MNGTPGDPVRVMILDREFHVGCAPEERTALLDAARYLDARLREMRDAARGIGLDRLAILAALNISHELLSERARGARESSSLAEKLQALNAKLDGAFGASLQ